MARCTRAMMSSSLSEFVVMSSSVIFSSGGGTSPADAGSSWTSVKMRSSERFIALPSSSSKLTM
eukprot:9756336-Heterocapsa_arctica.AAC.1